jgi:hypothetical protein
MHIRGGIYDISGARMHVVELKYAPVRAGNVSLPDAALRMLLRQPDREPMILRSTTTLEIVFAF